MLCVCVLCKCVSSGTKLIFGGGMEVKNNFQHTIQFKGLS